MANVRSRLKTQSSPKKRRGAVKNKPVNNTVESIAVMKSSDKSSEDKVQYSTKEDTCKINCSNPIPQINNKPKKKEFLVTKSGRIKKKFKDKLRLLDNILKSELLIQDTEKKPKSTNKKKVNNNNIGIDDHNKTGNVPNGINGKKKSSHVVKKDKPVKTKRKNPVSSPKKPTKSQPIPVKVVPVSQVYECDHCGKFFKTKSSIEKHIYGHLNLKPHQCPHCPKKFHYSLNMQVHIMKLHNVPNETVETIMCSICGKVFLLKEALNSHLSTHHSKKASFFKCIYCEKKFSEEVLLLEHEKTHLVTGRYQCPTCGYSYGIRNHFEAHLKSHTKVKDFVCQHCGKEFLRLNSMQRHVQVCHAGHRIQCPICKKKLKGHLTEHLRTHDKKRPHECPDCGQCFTQSTQLTVHRRSHTGARPYPCKICANSFSHSTALMLHIRRHTGEKPFRCAMCPLMFSQLPHMKAHMKTIHGKENAYKCEKCDQFFKLKVDLERHNKFCTVGDREKNSEENVQSSIEIEETEVESGMTLSRMRYLLALLLTIISSKDKLKYLGA